MLIGTGEAVPIGSVPASHHSVHVAVIDPAVGVLLQQHVLPVEAVVDGLVLAALEVTWPHRDYEGLWEVYLTEPHPGDDPRDMVTLLFRFVDS